MKLFSLGIIKKGNLTKSPPLDSKTPKRWHLRYFILYNPERIDDSAQFEKDLEDYHKSNKKEKRRKSSIVNIFRGAGSKEKAKESPNSVSLIYYESEEKEMKGSPPLKRIPLTGAKISENDNRVNGFQYVIDLETKDRKFHLCAENEIDHKSWLNVLKETLTDDTIAKTDSHLFVDHNHQAFDESLLGDESLKNKLDNLRRIRENEQTEIDINLEDKISEFQSVNKDSGISADVEEEQIYGNVKNSNQQKSSTEEINDSLNDLDIDQDTLNTGYVNVDRSSRASNSSSSTLENSQLEVAHGYINVNRQSNTFPQTAEAYDSLPNRNSSHNLNESSYHCYGNIDEINPPKTYNRRSGNIASPDNSEVDGGSSQYTHDEVDSDVYDVPPVFERSDKPIQQIPEIDDTDVYDIPPNTKREGLNINSTQNNAITIDPSQAFSQFDDDSDVYDVPPNTTINEFLNCKSNFINQQETLGDIDDSDVYDVPPNTTRNEFRNSNSNFVNQQPPLGDIDDSEVYDVPPNTTRNQFLNTKSNFVDQPQTLGDIDDSEIYVVPPNSTSGNHGNRQSHNESYPDIDNSDVYDIPPNTLNSNVSTDDQNNNTARLNQIQHNSFVDIDDSDIYDVPPTKTGNQMQHYPVEHEETDNYLLLDPNAVLNFQQQQQNSNNQAEIERLNEAVYNVNPTSLPCDINAECYDAVPNRLITSRYQFSKKERIESSMRKEDDGFHNDSPPPIIPPRISSCKLASVKRQDSTDKSRSLPTYYDTSFDADQTQNESQEGYEPMTDAQNSGHPEYVSDTYLPIRPNSSVSQEEGFQSRPGTKHRQQSMDSQARRFRRPGFKNQ